MSRKKLWRNAFQSMIIMMALGLIFSPLAMCQNWTALPPYNTLWPLWSPVLSPVDPVTGLGSPIVTSLTRDTILPVQPGLTWNPSRAYPWLLYNTPLGMFYFDEIFGLNAWPPLGLLAPKIGIPLQIPLPTDFATLAPTDSTWILDTVPIANDLYAAAYPYYAFLATLPLPALFRPPPILPAIQPLLLAQPIPGATTVVVPTALTAGALLGL